MGQKTFSEENPLKRVLPQTPFPNFGLGFDCPDYYRDNQNLTQDLGGDAGGKYRSWTGGEKMKGKVALVTGASQGIGAACAKRLGCSGAWVVVNYWKSEEKANQLVDAIESSRGRALAVKADVTDRVQVDSMVSQAIEHFGKIDILVNNAVRPLNRKAFLETSWEDYQYQIEGSLKAVVNCCQAVIPAMLERKQGCIINVLSTQVWRPGFGFQPYIAGKGAVQALSRALCQEFASSCIRVNMVSPSLTLSESKVKEISLEHRKASAARTPLGRNALPLDVAEAVFYLAGDGADFVTGINIPVNGGQVID
jgi:3-oxoacyl-[acyl-carrier protein] reductase